jgi:hypothetical protein
MPTFAEVAQRVFINGQDAFRLAASRAFMACDDRNAARVVLDLEVDVWLTPAERQTYAEKLEQPK